MEVQLPTQKIIRDAVQRRMNHVGLGGILGVFVVPAIMGAFVCIPRFQHLQNSPRMNRVVPVSFLFGGLAGASLGLLKVHFGLTLKLFGFGFSMPAILPSTCKASMPWEGADGLPCTLLRCKAWITAILSLHPGSAPALRIHPRWIVCAGLAGLYILLIVCGLVVKSPFENEDECHKYSCPPERLTYVEVAAGRRTRCGKCRKYGDLERGMGVTKMAYEKQA